MSVGSPLAITPCRNGWQTCERATDSGAASYFLQNHSYGRIVLVGREIPFSLTSECLLQCAAIRSPVSITCAGSMDSTMVTWTRASTDRE